MLNASLLDGIAKRGVMLDNWIHVCTELVWGRKIRTPLNSAPDMVCGAVVIKLFKLNVLFAEMNQQTQYPRQRHNEHQHTTEDCKHEFHWSFQTRSASRDRCLDARNRLMFQQG